MSFQELRQLQQVNDWKSLRYSDYFRAKQTLRNTSIMIPPEHQDMFFTSISYCRLACQVINERIELDAINAGSEEATGYLNDVLTTNGGALLVSTAHITAMEFGRSYLVPTGSNRDDGVPMVLVVPGRDMVHEVDPYTGEITEALQVFGKNRDRYVYYTKNQIVALLPGPSTGGYDGFTAVVTENGTGRVPVFPLICRGDADPNSPYGRPEAKDVFHLQDAATRKASDLSYASATMAAPQRGISGIEEDDFVRRNPDGSTQLDDDGNPVQMTGQEIYTARALTFSDPGAKFMEFTAAQLQNYSTGLNSDTRMAAAVMGVPQSVFGVSSDANPASGDSMAQDDNRLIRRAEQLIGGFNPTWISLWEYLLTSAGIVFEKNTVKNQWVDPSLPNLAARSDAALKLSQTVVDGRSLYSWRELRAMMGDSEDTIAKAEAQREQDQLSGLLTAPAPAPPVPVPANQGV